MQSPIKTEYETLKKNHNLSYMSILKYDMVTLTTGESVCYYCNIILIFY